MVAAPFPRVEGRTIGRQHTDTKWAIGLSVFFLGMVACVLSGYLCHIPLSIPLLSGYSCSIPSRLTHGSDFQGKICGVTTADPLKKYMMFCGSPERAGEFPKYIIEGSTVCVAACPTDASGEIECLMPAFHNFTSYRGGEVGATQNVETLEMTLTQSVTKQATYPTEQWGGRFCLPSVKNPGLRSLLIDGPWGQYYRPLVSVGGLMDAWPLFLISAGLAWVLGYLYLFMMQKCAGMVVLASMIFSTLFSLAAGFFFFFAIVMDMDDTTSTYAEFNPIMSVYIGSQAKAYSVVTGVIIILVGVIFAAMTATSLSHIDECIGLVEAAMDCAVRGGPCGLAWSALMLFATCQSAAFLALVFVAVCYGLPMVASLGVLGPSEISVNGQMISGLQQVWTKNTFQYWAFWYYLFGMLFLMEVFIQIGHYILSYVVASWYFVEGTRVPNNHASLLETALGHNKPGSGFGKVVEVRVGGVDDNYGTRKGTVVTGTSQKMLVVPVGRKGPGIGRNDMELDTFKKSGGPSSLNIVAGFSSVLYYHAGSLALGALIIWPLRPFRLLSQCVQNFLSRTADPSKGPAHSDDAHTANIKGCLSLFSACLETVFGKYSKTAYTELVLCGGGAGAKVGFMQASENAFQFLVKSGGSIAHLHGAMLMYEISGIFFITLTCGWTTLIIQDKVGIFNEKTSPHYIEDKNASAIVAMICAFVVSFCWMSMWNHTADTLLYCVAWNRHQHFEGEEHGLPEDPPKPHKHLEGHNIGEVTAFCPQSIRNLMPEYELSSHIEHGLHAHGLGQQGAILAAMEHGAMSAPAGAAPDYGKSIAGAHAMATRIVG